MSVCSPHRSQKRVSDPGELKFQAVVSYCLSLC